MPPMDPVSAGIMSGMDIAGQLYGHAQQRKSQKRQHTMNKEMQDRQQVNQMALNKQASDLAFNQWNRTNYSAQMAHMKEAGLNPALMYGMSGGGGTTAQTGSGGQASAPSGVQGVQPPFMDISQSMRNATEAILNLAKGDTEGTVQELNKAKTDYEKAMTTLKGTENTLLYTEINKNHALMAKIDQEALTEAERTELVKAQTKLAQSNLDILELDKRIKGLKADRADKGIANELLGDLFNMMNLDPQVEADRFLFQAFIYTKFGAEILNDIMGALPIEKLMSGGFNVMKEALKTLMGKGKKGLGYK